MSTESFGHRLRQERDRLELTQDDFGRLGGVKRLTQYLYEQDSRVPDLRYLMRLAEAGVDVVYLLLGRAERLADPECLVISPAQLTAAYSLVDEFATDGKGALLPLEMRLRFFQMLVSSIGCAGSTATPDQLRRQMSRFAHG